MVRRSRGRKTRRGHADVAANMNGRNADVVNVDVDADVDADAEVNGAESGFGRGHQQGKREELEQRGS